MASWVSTLTSWHGTLTKSTAKVMLIYMKSARVMYFRVRSDGVEPRIDELQGGDSANGHEFVQLHNE
jgi:hypothetical protein